MVFQRQALKQTWHARLESARTAIKDGTVQDLFIYFFNGFVHLLAPTYSPAQCLGWIFFFNETFTRCIWQTICRSYLFSASKDPQVPIKSSRPLLFPSLFLATWCPVRPIFDCDGFYMQSCAWQNHLSWQIYALETVTDIWAMDGRAMALGLSVLHNCYVHTTDLQHSMPGAVFSSINPALVVPPGHPPPTLLVYKPSLFSCVQLCATLWTISSPGSSVYGILKARILEWVAMPSFRGSSPPKD